MIKCKIHIILLIFCLSLMSCVKDFIDKPHDENNLSPGNYWTKPEDAFRTIVGAYAILKSEGLNGISSFYIFQGMDPDVTHEGQNYVIYQSFAFATDDQQIYVLYSNLCSGMYRSNLAIENIPKCFTGKYITDTATMKMEMGEMYFLRAYYGYLLTSLFYEPPAVYEVYRNNNEYLNLTNTKREKWIELLKSDLQKAIDFLPDQWDDKKKGRVMKSTAWAMLGRTCMLAEDWMNAELAFKKIIDEKVGNHGLILPKGKDSLDYVYAYLCNYSAEDLTANGSGYPSENNMESLFEVQEIIEGNTFWNLFIDGYGCDGSLYTTLFSPIGYWNIGAKQTFIEKYESRSFVTDTPLHYDARKYATVYLPGDTIKCMKDYGHVSICDSDIVKIDKLTKKAWNPTGNTIKKYMYPLYPYTTSSNKTDPTNHRLITYSDVLLWAAETKYQLGKDNEALNYMNQIRNRAGLASIYGATGAELKNIIIKEREIEKAMENTWSRELMRWSKTKDNRTGNYFINPVDFMPAFNLNKNEYFPIPQYNIDHMKGGGLKQNQGW